MDALGLGERARCFMAKNSRAELRRIGSNRQHIYCPLPRFFPLAGSERYILTEKARERAHCRARGIKRLFHFVAACQSHTSHHTLSPWSFLLDSSVKPRRKAVKAPCQTHAF